MASAWGNSWGASWGQSFGQTVVYRVYKGTYVSIPQIGTYVTDSTQDNTITKKESNAIIFVASSL